MSGRNGRRRRGSSKQEALGAAVERARTHLARSIELRHYVPGERLPSAAVLSREIGVSRPVVLKALQALEIEGKISVKPGRAGVRILDGDDDGRTARWAWVAENRDTIAAMALLREMVEPKINALVAEQGMSASLMREAHRIHERMAPQSDLPMEFYRPLDTEFHVLIARASGMPVLVDEVSRFRVWIGPTFEFLDWPPTRLDESHDQHGRLLDAIEARDPLAAEEVFLDHIRITSELIAKLLRKPRNSVRRPRRS